METDLLKNTFNSTTNTTELIPEDETPSDDIRAVTEAAKYTNGFIVILGLITNSLILIILSRRRIGSQTTRIILMFLAATDLLVMVIEFFIHYVPDYWGWFPVFYTDVGCGIAFLVQASVITTSAWYLVLMTVERFTVVWFPMKAKIICTQKKILVACILIPIASLIGFYYLLLDIGIYVNDEGYRKCAPKSSDDDSEAMTFKTKIIIWIVTYFFIPACVIVVLNVFIVMRLAKAQRQQMRMRSIKRTGSRKMSRTASTSSTGPNSIKKATTLVIAASVTFVVLMIPRGVSTAISLDVDWKYTDDAEEILDRIAYLLQYLNHAINFFLYVLANNNFRKELKVIFTCGKRRQTYIHRQLKGEDSECTQMTQKKHDTEAVKHTLHTCLTLLHHNNNVSDNDSNDRTPSPVHV